MRFNEYKHWRKPKKKNKDIIPKVIDNLDRIKDSLFNSTDSIAYNNAFAIDTVIKWLSTLTGVNESNKKVILEKCIKKLDSIYNSLNEEFKLMDKEEPEYQLGDAYIVDTKQELIDGLNKIIIGDTIALKQSDREITIYFNDENDYSILDDDGTIDDSLRYDDIGRIHDMTKEEVIDWIEVYI